LPQAHPDFFAPHTRTVSERNGLQALNRWPGGADVITGILPIADEHILAIRLEDQIIGRDPAGEFERRLPLLIHQGIGAVTRIENIVVVTSTTNQVVIAHTAEHYIVTISAFNPVIAAFTVQAVLSLST